MKRFINILYVADPVAPNTTSLARAIALAESNRANLTVVDIVPEISAGIDLAADGTISQAAQQALQNDHLARLEAMIELCVNKPDNSSRANVSTQVLTGTVFLEIIRAVLREGYDLVIKSAEDPTWMDRIFGSDDMHLLRKCPCPIWLHKPQEIARYKSVMAAVDLPEKESDQPELYQNILTLATSMAVDESAELHVVHAWQSMNIHLLARWVDNPNEVTKELIDSERARHEKAFLEFRSFVEGMLDEHSSASIAPQFHLLPGAPAEVIPAKAKEINADLVVMGTVNRTGIAGLFIGNTAEAILEQLHCSVLAIKPANFETPVKLP